MLYLFFIDRFLWFTLPLARQPKPGLI